MNKYLKFILVLSIGGILFSGYLSANKLFSGTCAFNETCPYFLGYPACFYGFGFFLILLSTSILGVLGKIQEKTAINTLFFVSLIGILFSGNFVSQEVASSKLFGNLGLSTCAYGLIFYIVIFILSCLACRKEHQQ